MPEEASHEHKEHHYNFKITKVRFWQGISAILAIMVIFLWFNPAFGTAKGIQPTTTLGGAAPTQQQQGNIKFDIPSFVPSRGSDSAKVTVIEFGDYQCPFCERFFSQIEPQLLQDYVNSGKVKFYFMDFAFLGPDSETLAQGAWCANEQGRYYDYHDYIYSHQGRENSGWATADKVKSIAANIQGLDIQKFSSCLDGKQYDSRVQQLIKLGQSNGVKGTPSVFVGNSKGGYKLIVGVQPYEAFKQFIDAELAK